MNTSWTTPTNVAVGCLVAASLVAASLAACSTPAAPSDRAGADTVTLHLATSDGEGVDPSTYQGPAAFVEALEDVSGGRLQVELTYDYASGAADAETQLVEAIADGDVDGGWPPTRAFAHAGIEGLEAVEAPMVLTNEKVVEELVQGDPADALLAQLEGTGLTGLGLMAAPLRRPVSGDEPLVAAGDWEDATFRVYNSPVQAAAVRALGGRPIDITHSWADSIRVGDLDGAEVDVMGSGLPTHVHHITSNVVLWPKVFVTTFNEELLDSLSGEQQQWVRAAAERGLEASVAAPYDASIDLQAYCDRGTAVHVASSAELDEIRTRLAPVLTDLRDDPETAEVMAVVEDLAHAYPDVDVPAPTGGCAGGAGDGVAGLPAAPPPIADGTYRAEIPVEATAEVGNASGWSGTWTMRIADGTFSVSCRPLDVPGTDCGHAVTDDVLEAGFLRGDEQTAWFVPDAELLAEQTDCELPPSEDDPDACLELPPYGATWHQEGDSLFFDEMLGREQYHLTLVAWSRIG